MVSEEVPPYDHAWSATSRRPPLPSLTASVASLVPGAVGVNATQTCQGPPGAGAGPEPPSLRMGKSPACPPVTPTPVTWVAADASTVTGTAVPACCGSDGGQRTMPGEAVSGPSGSDSRTRTSPNVAGAAPSQCCS